MIGIPIFAGFAAKLQFGLAAVEDGAGWRLILVFLALAVSSMLNALYFVRTIIRIYSRPNESTRMEVRPHHRAGYNVPMLVLTVMNLFLGLFSWVTVDLIHRGLMMFS